MQKSYAPQLKQPHKPRSFPATAAAVIAVLVFGGLAALMISGPPPSGGIFAGAVQDDPTATAETQDEFILTATAVIAKATYDAAATQLAEAQSQFDSAQQVATENALQHLVDRGLALTVCGQIETLENTPLYDSPSLTANVVGTAPTNVRLEVGSVLTLLDSEADWLHVTAEVDGAEREVWVLPHTIRPVPECANIPNVETLIRSLIEQQASSGPTVPPPAATATITASATFTATPSPTHTATITPSATRTTTPTITASPFIPLPTMIHTAIPPQAMALPSEVTMQDDGSYEITIPMAPPVESDDILPGDVVDVMALFNYGQSGQIWAAVAENLTVVDMNAESDSPTSSFATLYVTLSASEESTLTTIERLARAGTALTLVLSS